MRTIFAGKESTNEVCCSVDGKCRPARRFARSCGASGCRRGSRVPRQSRRRSRSRVTRGAGQSTGRGRSVERHLFAEGDDRPGRRRWHCSRIVGVIAAAISAGPVGLDRRRLSAAGRAVGYLGLVALVSADDACSYRLTTFPLFHETGHSSRTRDRIEVIDIDDVTLQQGLIERMFNVGTIHMRVQRQEPRRTFNMHRHRKRARRSTDLIDNTRRAERQRRGVFMENVGRRLAGSRCRGWHRTRPAPYNRLRVASGPLFELGEITMKFVLLVCHLLRWEYSS